MRLISAAGLQAAQRVQHAANQKRIRDRARAVAAPVRGNAPPPPALPLPPGDGGDGPGDGGDGGDDPGDADPVLPAGRPLGCTKCRFGRIGCKQCRNPDYVPRGKGRGKGGQPQPKAKPKAQPKASVKGRGRGRGRGRAAA